MSQDDVRTFVEDAVKGGWKAKKYLSYEVSDLGFIQFYESQEQGSGGFDGIVPVATALLDPSAWNAVGATRKWPGGFYKDVMRAFTGMLIDGRSPGAALRQLAPLRSLSVSRTTPKWVPYDS